MEHSKEEPNTAAADTQSDRLQGDEAGAPHPAGRRQRTRHGSARAASQVFDTVESAAVRLDLDANALRARCRRAARQVGDAVVAQLGGGITAFKFGKSWRIRFPARL
jgi:hypothetical protein